MFKIHEIREIIRLIDKSSIHEIKLENDGAKLVLKKQSPGQVTMVAPTQVQQAMPVEQTAVVNEVKETNEQFIKQAEPVVEKKANVEDKNLHQIKSPMVGTFYEAHSPDAPAYMKVGDTVNEESIVCIVEAMKLFNEIEAEVKGEVVEILVENGQLVEYGQPLFLVKAK